MATRRQRERRKVSAKETADKQSADFEMTSLRLPEGVYLFNVKQAGVKRLEIIPFEAGAGNPDAEEGDLYFMRTFYTHRGIGPNQDTYVCPAKTSGKRCPVCEHRQKLDKNPDADPELVKDLLPKKRQLWNVYDHAEPDRGVQVWDVSYHLFGKQLFALVRDADEDDEYEFFADPEDGLTLKVGFAEKSWAGHSYREAETIVFKPRKGALDDDILDAANPLDSLLIELDYDDLKAVLEGTAEGGGGDDDDDDDPPPAKGKGKSKSKPAPADDDDDDEPTAESMGIEAGADVKVKGVGKATVLKISEDGKTVTVEDEDEEMHKVPVAHVKPASKPKPAPEPEPEKPLTAKEAGLEVGDMVKHPEHGPVEIIKISKDGISLTVEDGDEEIHNAIGVAEVKKGKGKPASKPKPDPEPEPEPDDPSDASGDDDDWDEDWD